VIAVGAKTNFQRLTARRRPPHEPACTLCLIIRMRSQNQQPILSRISSFENAPGSFSP
jgi:hypothetical protein